MPATQIPHKRRKFQVVAPTPWPMINIEDEFYESPVPAIGHYIRLDTRSVAKMELNFDPEEVVEVTR